MKKILSTLGLLILISVALLGCRAKKETTQSKTSSSQASSSVKVANSSSQSTSQSSIEESTAPSSASTQASYNGSYYSVQGKYGEVIIVNKKHPLSSSYAPGEDPTAVAAFWQLVSAMQEIGYSVSNNYSGFRSYETQSGLYNNYVASDGQASADRYSARPGYSEHQTGLAFDLTDTSGALLTEYNASQWLIQNAHHYGFVVRYLDGKESITGYMAESWHIRYIGQEATDIYNSGLTLEEYYGVPGGGYVE
ncbi:LD-carboxypeptidase LdcB/DacB [Streptococcus merionis]|uniref:LD-carboxypeptidase LdcB/DacB n=1 Tax=Streptococcus merionis TaxID=400065 RepID=UPI003510EFAB